MAPERNRTTNQQGRQRSCGECAKAKRRCDLGQPSCFRCTRQKLTCSYPFPSLTNVDSAEEGETPAASEDSSNDLFPLDVLIGQAPQNVETLNFEFNSGTESINGLLNGNTGEETVLPHARSAYVLGKQFPGVNLSAVAYSRIGYGIEQLKVAVSSMVLATQTPWSHPLLYEDFMPRCLQGTASASLRYIF
jgi:Fungal Zn(2)-Cys(6) binuclear cluster domain